MKKFFEKYLQIINEQVNLSSRYIEKKFFVTIDHIDVFYTSAFFNSFPNDSIRVNQFVNKFITMVNVSNIKRDKEFLIYDPQTKIAVIVNVYIKGSFRHDVILMSSFTSNSCPSIQKTGQIRIIF